MRLKPNPQPETNLEQGTQELGTMSAAGWIPSDAPRFKTDN
jgi:hypothetical protein